VDEATTIDLDEWKTELESHEEFFTKIGSQMPAALKLYRQMLLARIATIHR
jgi:GTP-dependent phosphoenolpyruvate carboxykinase